LVLNKMDEIRFGAGDMDIVATIAFLAVLVLFGAILILRLKKRSKAKLEAKKLLDKLISDVISSDGIKKCDPDVLRWIVAKIVTLDHLNNISPS